jgi:Ca-activated chloride channel family protein
MPLAKANFSVGLGRVMAHDDDGWSDAGSTTGSIALVTQGVDVMVRHDVRVSLATALITAVLGPGSAAHSYAQPSVFNSGVEMVPLTVTVTDGEAGYVTGLSPDDFIVLEDGVPQEITFFAAGDVPIDLALLIDASGSMDADLPLVRAAAKGLVRTLGDGDRGGVFMVNASVSMPQAFTSDHERIATAIDAVTAGGGTAIYDGLYAALRELERQRLDDTEVRRQVLVALSDGLDNASHVSPEDVAEATRDVGAQLFAIMMAPRRHIPGSELGLAERRAAFELRSLARNAGGRSFQYDSALALPGIYQAIATELKSQYDLGYVPREPSDTRAFRRLTVRLRPPARGVARTRSGYYPENRTPTRVSGTLGNDRR